MLRASVVQFHFDVIRSVDSESGRVLFVDAPGGTGKTFLMNLLIAGIRMHKTIAISVASSGIAATLLDSGKTALSVL